MHIRLSTAAVIAALALVDFSYAKELNTTTLVNKSNSTTTLVTKTSSVINTTTSTKSTIPTLVNNSTSIPKTRTATINSTETDILVGEITKKNTGKLPGTYITLYGLMDPITGKSIDFSDFVQTLLPGAPSISNENGLTRKKSLVGRDINDVESYNTWCIPQLSIVPEANPYHEELTGKKFINYITCAGRPIEFPNTGIDCPVDVPQPCVLAIIQLVTRILRLILSLMVNLIVLPRMLVVDIYLVS